MSASCTTGLVYISVGLSIFGGCMMHLVLRCHQLLPVRCCNSVTDILIVCDIDMLQESFAATTGQLNENNAGAYSSELWSQSKTLWSCNLCGAWLGSSRTLRNHVRKKHMALKTERCRLCGETFRWSGQVARHKRIFHPESL